MFGQLIFLTSFILVFSHSLVLADSLDPSTESRGISTENSLRQNDFSCQNIRYTHKKFRLETVKNLPFPPGAFLEVKKCMDEGVQEDPGHTEEALNRKKKEQEETVRKLSLLLSFIDHQKKALAGSYQKTDRAYDDLRQSDFPDPKPYAHAVTNYEDALKNYGMYQAYLSALPRAMSDYENNTRSSFKDFSRQNADGAITMMKIPSSAETLDKNSLENGQIKKQKEAKQNLCMLAGAIAGGTVVEGIVLATFSNPMSAVLGASLGATLCSEKFYERMTLWPRSFKAKVVDMGVYIKGGLEEIGKGLSNIGNKYLYTSPSKTSYKIAEHFENAKSWLNRKLGWQ